jgi:hypothetical protein
MTNSRKITLVGGVLLFGLLLVWLLTPSESYNESPGGKKFYSSNWTVQFQPFDKHPRGTFLFHRLLQVHISGKNMYLAETKEALDSIMAAKSKPRTYLFVGNIFALEEAEIDSIISEVSKVGSNLFLSFNKTGSNISDHLFDEFHLRSDYDVKQTVFTSRGDYEMWNVYQKDTVAQFWKAFGDVETKGASQALSSFMEMDNFISIEMGKGKVFVHTNPNMFFNYQLTRTPGFEYASYAIDQLPKNRDVILLELGRMPDDFGNTDTEESTGNKMKEDTSYLRILFEDPFLRTALILAIVGILLYVLFRSRRKRPVVPYLAKKKNMTLAFTETITSIYYSKQSPYGLLQLQKKNFYTVLLKHFFVDLKRREGNRELRILSEKSNKPFEEIEAIVNQLETQEVSAVNDETITEMAKRLRQFYKDVGIISERIETRVKQREMVFRRSLWVPGILLFLGLLFIVQGLYLLIQSQGIGIALIPLGIILCVLGSIRLRNPYLVVTDVDLIYYNPFGQKKSYRKEDIIRASATKNGVLIQLQNDTKVLINYWDMSRFDREQFDRFISKVHTLDL